MKVLVLAGDGSTYDMGLSATSAAIHRGLDFWYLCYDNEAYGNTGFQMSSSSPFASRTTTSPVGKEEPEGTFQEKKDMFEIWRAQKPPYVATVASHEVVDLAEKVHRSLAIKGPKLFLALAVCPTGWGFDPRLGDELAHLAVKTGIWPSRKPSVVWFDIPLFLSVFCPLKNICVRNCAFAISLSPSLIPRHCRLFNIVWISIGITSERMRMGTTRHND